jgi:hypothetical protein
VGDTGLNDREQIYDLMVRYGRANDTNDVDLLKSCLTDDIVADFPLSGHVEGIDAVAEIWLQGVLPMNTTHHFTNFSFDLDGDTGSFSCLLIAQHWPGGTEGTGETPTYLVGGRYDVSVRRTVEGWRASGWKLTILWTSGDASVLEHLTTSH